MQALARQPATAAIATMQAINRTVLNPGVLGVFFGTALLGLVIGLQSAVNWGRMGSGRFVAGSAFYVLGTLVVTVVANVSPNNRLALLRPAQPDAPVLWADYFSTWTVWKHLRTAGDLAAALAWFAGLWQARGCG